MMALVSFPRSGNSWLRQLIEAATGVFTGSFYQATDSLADFFPGELRWRDGSTIVQKTHQSILNEELADPLDHSWRLHHMSYFNNNGILLIREGFKKKLNV